MAHIEQKSLDRIYLSIIHPPRKYLYIYIYTYVQAKQGRVAFPRVRRHVVYDFSNRQYFCKNIMSLQYHITYTYHISQRR
jgi:hypothetical protein